MNNQGIQLLPGADNIKSVYQRVLKSKTADFICLSTGYEAVIGEWYEAEFEPQLFESKVQTREVVADTTGNRSYGAKKDGVKNQARYLKDVAESDLILGDDFVAIVSFNPASPYAVVIEDPTIITSAKVWFEAIWASAAR
ncbi:MAG: hypothetical protein V1487_03100 [bacterium]